RREPGLLASRAARGEERGVDRMRGAAGEAARGDHRERRRREDAEAHVQVRDAEERSAAAAELHREEDDAERHAGQERRPRALAPRAAPEDARDEADYDSRRDEDHRVDEIDEHPAAER